jgi:AcrR family transcriptional regulator
LFRLTSGIVLSDVDEDHADDAAPPAGGERRLRADAQRSIDALLAAAKAVFATSGVDAPVREIAERAGVGVGTVYRRFPQRADLIAAVCRREMDACADAALVLAADYPPFEALAHWLSGDPAFEALPAYFEQRLRPALGMLLDAATAAGEARADVDPDEILGAVSSLCVSMQSGGLEQSQRMVGLLADGLRYRPKLAE